MNTHLVFGLTGHIGAGKSTVASILHKLGARVLDSDVTIRNLLESDVELQQGVHEAFPEVWTPDRGIDRAALGRTVFADQEQLHILEDLLYPKLREMEQGLLAEPTNAPVTFIEAINVVEGPSGPCLDGLWIVQAGESLLIERAVATRRLTSLEVQARLSMQASPEAKDHAFRHMHPGKPVTHITNEGDLYQLRERVTSAWHQLLGN